jgi:mRNA interferase MazF
VKRYDIYLARLDPVEGTEMGKTRPVVIVSDDLRNRALPNVVCCPLTKQLHPDWRTRLHVRCRGLLAEVAVDQIRVLSKSRFTRKIDHLSTTDAAELRRLIAEMYASA